MEERNNLGQPDKPDASDCCNSGCDPCILDLYEKRVKEWENNSVTSSNLVFRNDLLSETKLKSFHLINKAKLLQNVYRFKFQPALNNKSGSKNIHDLSTMNETIIEGVLPYKIGQHIVIRGVDLYELNDKFTENAKGVNLSESKKKIKYLSRAYTPISVSTELSNCCFEIIVKIYNNGKMSKYLNTLQIGDIISCRGPYGNFVYSANKHRYILMLCIGTGIAPMYNIIKSVINNDEDETFLHLMYGVQTVDDIILRDELREFTDYWNFKEEIYFSNQSDEVIPKFGETFLYKRINSKAVLDYASDKNKDELLILICGTDVFNRTIENCVLNFGIDKSNIHVF